MPVKRLEELKPGDTIGSDVLNPQGLILVKSGVVVEEKHLRLFKQWGVEKLTIQDGRGERNSEEYEALLMQAETEIKARFGSSLDNEVMADILHLAAEQRAAGIIAEAE